MYNTDLQLYLYRNQWNQSFTYPAETTRWLCVDFKVAKQFICLTYITLITFSSYRIHIKLITHHATPTHLAHADLLY